MELGSVNAAGAPPSSESLPVRQTAPPGGFAGLLHEAIAQVNTAQQDADNAARDFAVAEAQSVHDTIIKLEQADLSLRLLTQVRNKVVEAYQEFMRMSI